MATGDLHLLGTLYTGGVKRLLPTNPVQGGDVNQFTPGHTIEIRNTDIDNAYKLRWREVNTGASKLFIADRNILHSVSWDDLNSQGLVFGKAITIDGQEYNLRILSGGATYRKNGDPLSGGSPVENEWDRLIVNEENHVGLPIPTATDLTNNPSNVSGLHNKFWNWFNFGSTTMEVRTGSPTSRSYRGWGTARNWDSRVSNSRDVFIGYRPVLEVLESKPEIYVNINETQRKVESIHVRVNNEWRKADTIHANINGIWRKS